MDFELAKKIAREANLKILREEINQKWVIDKILSHLDRHPHLQMSVSEVQTAILNDDLTASFFIKDPGRQNITEKIASTFLGKIAILKELQYLGSSSNLFLLNGEITQNRIAGVKSLDFSWKLANKNCYATQKYTLGSGGAQDNQFHDVLTSVREANSINDSNLYFFAIVDGDYYTNEKISILQNEATNSQIIICGLEEVEEECLKILKKN